MPKYGHKQAKKLPTWQWNLRKFQIAAKSLDFNLKIYQKKFSAFSPQLCQKKEFLNLVFHNFQLFWMSHVLVCARARAHACSRTLLPARVQESSENVNKIIEKHMKNQNFEFFYNNIL